MEDIGAEIGGQAHGHRPEVGDEEDDGQEYLPPALPAPSNGAHLVGTEAASAADEHATPSSSSTCLRCALPPPGEPPHPRLLSPATGVRRLSFPLTFCFLEL